MLHAPPSLDLAVIGNSSFSALIDKQGTVVWSCLPGFDGDPVFNALLRGSAAESGLFAIQMRDFLESEQAYEENTAILRTVLRDRHGNAAELIDFAPKFKKFDRSFRPGMVTRILRPLAGTPRLRVVLRPTFEYGTQTPQITRGSNHIRYVSPNLTLRLNTTIAPAYVVEERSFLLESEKILMLGPDESLTSPAVGTAHDFLEQTRDFWREWCRSLTIPFEWQDAVLRAAITLKLSSYEETGAIVAAMTTSVPEAPNTQRNWDYRFCWLRDSFFTVHALNRLGATLTMENYLEYISNVAASSDNGYLQPLFGISLENTLPEELVDTFEGYRGMGPVRIGNAAYDQVQNDGYGSVILATAQCFFDRRLTVRGGEALFGLLEHLGEQARSRYDQPDAGLWELRGRQRTHTFSSVMCWAACDRLARIAARLGKAKRHDFWRAESDRIREDILKRAWNPEVGSFVESFGGRDLDASLLMMAELGIVEPTDRRFLGTLAAAERHLRVGPYLYRYHAADDFGHPETSFNICTYWYIIALASAGRVGEARELFENMLRQRNHVGLLSEDIDPETGELWGNFPQTYSMVGLILAAMRLSKSWEEAF